MGFSGVQFLQKRAFQLVGADKSSLIGIYGGTFDPIHFGHLRVAEELIDSINLQHIIFVPSGEPRLRNTPIGTRYQRTEMIRLAIQDNHQYFGHYHTAGVPGRHEIDERQELYYPAIMRAIAATGYKGYVAQEFIPKDKDAMASLRKAIEICDI